MRLPLLVAGILLAPGPVLGQIPYHVFDEQTEVASLRFVFPGTRSFDNDDLREQIVLRQRGSLAGLQEALDFLPLVPSPAPRLFAPLELQRDVARLREFYRASGFIDTRIRYEVNFIGDDNRVDVDLIIEEGRPIILDTVRVALPGGGDPAERVPEELASAWERFAARKDSAIGRRYVEADGRRISGQLLDWWMERGWPFARATTTPVVDSAAPSVVLEIELDPGPRARVDSLDVQGNESVSRSLVTRTVPLAPGEWFNSAKLAEGQRKLFGLSLFRLALTDVPADQPRDSTVRVRIRLEESPPRLLTGELGYVSAGGGLTTRGEFAHRNFTGGARTLRLNLVAQTGLLVLGERPEQDYQASFSFREPLFLHRKLSLSVSPFARYQDNRVDRSSELGVESSLLFEQGASRFITFQHRYSGRRVLDYRLGSGTAVDLETLLTLAAGGALDSLRSRIQRNTFALSAAIGRADPTLPVRWLQLRPSVEVTAPPGLNTIEFLQVDLPISGHYPLARRVAISAQARIGRVFPFGKTVRGDTIGPIERVQLREVLLTAGGTGSVRGWGNALLGPKLLNLVFETLADGDSIRVTGTDGYLAGGGFARATASVELRLPFPGLGPRWATHLFLDAGRVWDPDTRLRATDPGDEARWFLGTGAGIDLATLVGPVRISLGYKLNPSLLDLRRAQDVLQAILDERPIASVPADWRRRLHLHVSLGQSF